MKNLAFVLMIVLFSLQSWGGGVDVGNHKPQGFRGSYVVPAFESEEALVSHVEKLLPEIEKGSVAEVKRMIKDGACSSQSIKFDLLEVVPSYKINAQSLRLQKEFFGLVVINLKSCRRPARLSYYDHE
jgi:hypothetical protein